MKKVAVFVLLAYAALFLVLTWPVILAALFVPPVPDQHLPPLKDVAGLYLAWQYWVFIAVVLICQAGLLLIPVKVAGGRPVSRRSVWLPVIVSGFLIGALLFGVTCAIVEICRRAPDFGTAWQGWTALGACVLVWAAWSVIFCRAAAGQEPRDVVTRQCRRLLQGSVIALLVAVPTHIVARSRDYCCAGFMTFVGIAFGLAVMLISFGPGLFFLYAERWKKLHPGKQ